MKWFFSFLLVLSILFFVLMQWGGALTGAAKSGQPLAELNPEKIQLLGMPAVKQAPASAVLPVQPAVAVSAPTIASAPSAIPAPSSSAVVVPLPASAAVSVVAAPILPAPASIATAKPVAKICMEWGEFSGTDLARAGKELAGLKLDDRLAQRTVEYASGYWVYIPPLTNKAALHNKIEEIKAAGLEDYYVLKETRKWNNAISLGVFKTEEAAKKFLLSVKKKGFRNAQVGERKRKLKFTVFVLKRIDAAEGSKLATLQKGFANSELKTVPCK
jgi:SPOR domain